MKTARKTETDTAFCKRRKTKRHRYLCKEKNKQTNQYRRIPCAWVNNVFVCWFLRMPAATAIDILLCRLCRQSDVSALVFFVSFLFLLNSFHLIAICWKLYHSRGLHISNTNTQILPLQYWAIDCKFKCDLDRSSKKKQMLPRLNRNYEICKFSFCCSKKECALRNASHFNFNQTKKSINRMWNLLFWKVW